MTRVWVYSVGDARDAQERSEKPFPSNFSSSLEIDRLQKGVPDCAVDAWAPFRSERQHRGEPQIIVLLVGEWHQFTKMDYFVSANALALHESGVARLVPVLCGGTDAEPQADAWPERYRLQWKRLAKMAVMNGAGQTECADDLLDSIRDQVNAAITSGQNISESIARPVTVFFSYCHRDEKLRDELGRHLKLLERTGLIEGWHDRKIMAGGEWAEEIDNHLYTSDLILLLLSSDFFASDYCSEIETPIALERHKAKAACAIPVVLRPVVWRQSPISHLQALPREGKPVIEWPSTDTAFVDVCEGILKSAMMWKGRTAPPEDVTASEKARYSARRRVLDAAVPGHVEFDKAVMIVVLIRRSTSPGLRALLAADNTYRIEPDEVTSTKPVLLQFPIGESNRPEAISVTVVVRSPDFDPPVQERTVTLQPDSDSQPVILMLAAKKMGHLALVVELHRGDRVVVNCPLNTFARVENLVLPKPSIASATFDVDAPFISGLPIPADPLASNPPNPVGESLERQITEREAAIQRAIAEVQALSEAGEFKRAMSAIEAALAAFPDNSEFHRTLDTLQAKLERRSQFAGLLAQARRHTEVGEYDAALTLAGRAAELYPNDDEAAKFFDSMAQAQEQKRRRELLGAELGAYRADLELRRAEAERMSREETARKAQELVERQKIEDERQARAQYQRQGREEANLAAREEAERLERLEAERRLRDIAFPQRFPPARESSRRSTSVNSKIIVIAIAVIILFLLGFVSVIHYRVPAEPRPSGSAPERQSPAH